ncbi:MAG: WG repeat-containing protein [Deltaproteobacteria bacterium]|nr:WG repeat-containing protein [Deltaproteobacteria bacterium]
MVKPVWAVQFELAPDVLDLNGPGQAKPGAGQELQCFQFNNLWGYLDLQGQVVLEPIFGSAENFFPNGLAKVANSAGKIGLIDPSGAWVVQPGLDGVVFANNDGDFGLMGQVGSWWGALDNTGRWLIKPRFKELGYLSQGLYKAQYHGVVGLLSPTAGWLVKPKYSSMLNIGSFTDKSKNLIKIFVKDEKNNNETVSEGIINLKGKVLIDPKFTDLNQVHNNLDYFFVSSNKKFGVIDLKGNFIVPLSRTTVVYNEKRNELWVEHKDSDPLAYTLDKPGTRTLTMAETWEFVNDLKWKLAPCMEKIRKKDQGYCDNQGRYIIGAYQEVQSFSDFGLARVKKGGKFGYIDVKGQVAVEFNFEDGGSFYDPGVAVAKSKGKWGLINSKGGWLIKPERDMATFIPECQLVVVKDGEKYGVFRASGSVAFKPMFEDYRHFPGESRLWLKLNGFWGTLDKKAKWEANPKFEEISSFNEQGLMRVKYKKKFALINKKIEFLAYNDLACNQNVVKNGANQIIWPKNIPQNCQ